ncbi:MAG: DNA replication/repair protein RecF [Chitinispirillaceae bacterium]
MHLNRLRLQNFRNYTDLEMEFPPQGALFEGANGAGKTNLLESIHLLCTGRSQRRASRATMIRHEEHSAFAEGVFSYEQAASKASIGFSRDKKVVMRRDDVVVNTFSEWFGERPVVSFGIDDLDLVYGSPESRRRFLDMLLCQMDRSYLEALVKYRRSMLCRNSLMGKTDDPLQFELYEEGMAEAGVELVFGRQKIVSELKSVLSDFYRQISEGSESADVEYEPRWKCDLTGKNECKNVFLHFLSERREKDVEMGFSASGPHRDDLRFLLDRKPAKTFGSQGQCRSYVLSLKLGSVLLIERHIQDNMIFLIDDAVSELDSGRSSRVYPLLEGKGQVFIATPKCDAPLGNEVLKCSVDRGKVLV